MPSLHQNPFTLVLAAATRCHVPSEKACLCRPPGSLQKTNLLLCRRDVQFPASAADKSLSRAKDPQSELLQCTALHIGTQGLMPQHPSNLWSRCCGYSIPFLLNVKSAQRLAVYYDTHRPFELNITSGLEMTIPSANSSNGKQSFVGLSLLRQNRAACPSCGNAKQVIQLTIITFVVCFMRLFNILHIFGTLRLAPTRQFTTS